jgi:hypothetical protein
VNGEYLNIILETVFYRELFAGNTTIIFVESVGLGVLTPLRFFNYLSSDYVDGKVTCTY